MGFKYVDMARIDLSLNDEYPKEVIPDEDIETTLKVIRSLRNWCLGPSIFHAEVAVILSHAHRVIVEMITEVQKIEDNENKTKEDNEQPTEENDSESTS